MKSKMGNGFFRWFIPGTILAMIFGASPVFSQRAEKRVAFHDNKVSVVLPDGWKASDRKGEQLVAGFEASDQRSSVFFTLAAANGQADMLDIMDGAVTDFENAFDVKKVGEYKTGQVQGPNKKWPAIFTTLELEMKTHKDPVPFRFYVLIFETGSHVYLVQGSTMSPVRKSREKEIYAMIHSIIAKND